MQSKLKDRILSYQELSDHKLLPKLPLIISVNGRGFSKTTQLLDKPYCSKFAECICSTTMRLCVDVEGALFGYQHNDEIVIVARNDQSPETTPWYGNCVQKIASITSAIATSHFAQCASHIQLNLTGEPLFTSQVFAVPNIAEAINTIIYKQQNNFHTSIQFACLYQLINKGYDKNAIKEMLAGLSVDEKILLLKQECQIDFHSFSTAFRRGAAVYKVPKVVDGVMKNKWHPNLELPIFTKDQSFLTNIFRNGADIFRQESF
jgi:tRNA(His) 5'-end guanylyltransferase